MGEFAAKQLGVPPALGGQLGNIASKLFNRILGKGDYVAGPEHVDRNSLLMPRQANSVPFMHSDQGMVRVCHREYIGDITTSVLPVRREYVIQPSNGALFPWLANFARSFEQYRLMGMVIEYVATSGNAVSSTNAALGSISMATQYNLRTAPFPNKRSLLNHYFSVSGAPSTNLSHPIECKDMYDPYKSYYIRTEAQLQVGAWDERLSDYGMFQLITQGSQAIYTGGELWVTYDVMLFKPRLALDASVLFIDPVDPPLEDDTTIYHHVPQIDRCCEYKEPAP